MGLKDGTHVFLVIRLRRVLRAEEHEDRAFDGERPPQDSTCEILGFELRFQRGGIALVDVGVLSLEGRGLHAFDGVGNESGCSVQGLQSDVEAWIHRFWHMWPIGAV